MASVMVSHVLPALQRYVRNRFFFSRCFPLIDVPEIVVARGCVCACMVGGKHNNSCCFLNNVILTVFLHTQSIPNADLEEVLAGFRGDTTLARATVVWKKGNGSRLGRAEVVLELLQHNPMTESLCEDLFLDAIHGDKHTVRLNLPRVGAGLLVSLLRISANFFANKYFSMKTST